MSRLAACFSELAAAGRTALVPYITSGHPRADLTVPIMHALVANGANVIELGVPFSDPMADGPTVQQSNEKALALGIGLRHVLDYVAEFRLRDNKTPIVLMGYANPIERMGSAVFLDRASSVGVDGVIVVDYPPEESEQFALAARAVGIDLIFLLAPTSTPQRIASVLALASGYIYYVSLRGITGGTLDRADVARRVTMLKAQTGLPIGVGFGIRDAETARAVAETADAVIIGSRMIQVLDEGDVAQATTRAGVYMSEIRAALDAPA
jgi:tryptophan synthase alpha chain